MINLARLEIFLRVADQKSFSDVARQMNVTQPTISHHIKALEDELGITLFERAGSSVELTEAGRFVLPLTRRLLHQAAEFQEMVSSCQRHIYGNLKIACTTTAGKYVLPLLSARFCKQYPGTHVSMDHVSTDEAVRQLLNHQADLAIVSHEVCGDELTCQKFFDDHITLIVPRDHPWASAISIQPDDLIGQPIISRESTSGTYKTVMAALACHDVEPDDLNIFLELGNSEAIVRTVVAGYGVAFVSRAAASCALNRGDVAEVVIAGVAPYRRINLVRKRVTTVPNRTRDAFWSFVNAPDNLDLYQQAGVTD